MGLKRRVRKLEMDRIRLMGDLAPNEVALESYGSWALVGWPIFYPRDPSLFRDNPATFFPPDMLDSVIRPSGVLPMRVMTVLTMFMVTNRRLLVLPLDAFSPAPRGQRYAVFAADALQRRSIPLDRISAVRVMRETGDVLPTGEPVEACLKIQGSGGGVPLVDGPQVPDFDTGRHPEASETFGPESGVVVASSYATVPGMVDLLVGLEDAGVSLESSAHDLVSEFDHMRGKPWRPLHERLSR